MAFESSFLVGIENNYLLAFSFIRYIQPTGNVLFSIHSAPLFAQLLVHLQPLTVLIRKLCTAVGPKQSESTRVSVCRSAQRVQLILRAHAAYTQRAAIAGAKRTQDRYYKTQGSLTKTNRWSPAVHAPSYRDPKNP